MGSSAIPRNLKQMTLITQNGLTRWRSGALTGVLRANCDCFQDLGYHRLPNAPSMKIYCIYGHGKETEACHVIVGINISYSNAIAHVSDLIGKRRLESSPRIIFLDVSPVIRYARGKYDRDIPYADQPNPQCLNSTGCTIEGVIPEIMNPTIPRPPLDMPLLRENWIDTSVVENGGRIPVVRVLLT